MYRRLFFQIQHPYQPLQEQQKSSYTALLRLMGFQSTSQYQSQTTMTIEQLISDIDAEETHRVEELIIIRDALRTFNQDNSSNLVNNDSRFQHEQCKAMLSELQELMLLYPQYPSTDKPYLDGLKTYQDESTKHHEKVLSLAECLLPNLNALLSRSKQNTEHTNNETHQFTFNF